MNWLWIWWIGCVVIFLGAHYWMWRSDKKKTAEIFAAHDKAMERIWAAHDKAMERIWAAHQVRMDELFAKYRQHRK
jgi:hypothetical protein